MGLAPILVERSFEIIKQVHEAGVAMLVVEQNANVSLSIADRGYVLSTGRSCSRATAERAARERGPPEGLPWPLSATATLAGALPAPLPDLRAARLRQLAARRARSRTPCAPPTRPTSTGWDEHGAPWDYWVERAEAARAAFARLVGADAGRGRGHDLALGRASARSRARSTSTRAAEDRHLRLRVPDGRPDLARAGAARRRGRPRAGRRRARSRSSASRRRSTSGRRSSRSRPSATGTARGSTVEEIARLAHERGALVLLDAYQAAGSYPLDVRELGVDFLAAGVAQVPARLGRARLPLRAAAGSSSELLPTQTGWFADRDIFEMDIRDYSPVADRAALPVGHAAGPVDLRGHRRHRADPGDRDRRDARARERR